MMRSGVEPLKPQGAKDLQPPEEAVLFEACRVKSSSEIQFSLLSASARHSWAKERTSGDDFDGPRLASFSSTAGEPSSRTAT
jgi:hypothetical protein